MQEANCCAVLRERARSTGKIKEGIGKPIPTRSNLELRTSNLEYDLVTIPEGYHPFPSRTRKLRPPGLKILQGKIRRCQVNQRLHPMMQSLHINAGRVFLQESLRNLLGRRYFMGKQAVATDHGWLSVAVLGQQGSGEVGSLKIIKIIYAIHLDVKNMM